MGFKEDIPQPEDKLSRSQADILGNFESISTGFNINHGGFNDPDKKGKHTIVSLFKQDAAPTTGSDEGALYTKKDVSDQVDLFYRKQSDGKEVQLTGGTAASTGHATVGGTVVLSWGVAAVTGSPSATITAAGITTIFNVQISSLGNVNSFFAFEALSGNHFRIIRNPGGPVAMIHWLAIGI